MCSGRDSDATLESSTLHIFSSQQRRQSPRELYLSESQDEASNDSNSDEAVSKGAQLVCTQLRVSPAAYQRGQEPDEERCFSPGDLVELQVSLSKQTSSDLGSASLGSALGILGDTSGRETAEMVHKSSTGVFLLEPGAPRKPLKQLGVVVASPTVPGQTGGLLELPAGLEGRSITRVGGPEVSGNAGPHSAGEEEEEEEGGGGGRGDFGGDPRPFSVSFGIPSDQATPVEEQDSDSEGDQDKPHKHHARHASKCSGRTPVDRRATVCLCVSRLQNSVVQRPICK